MTLRAVCYARVSSVAQRERDTIASQLRTLPEFVERQGWTLVRPVETYTDDGYSAKAGKLGARVGLAAMLRDAAAGVFDVLVVVEIDRLTRSEDLTERGAILGALQRAGVKVASAASGQVFDFSTSSGDLFGTLQAFFAAEWARKHRERIVQGKLTAIQRGRKPSGPTPYGLAYERATGAWSVDPVTGPNVLEMFTRVAGGDSSLTISNDFQDRDIARPRGAWTREGVWKIVRSRHPVGEWIVDKRRRLTIAVPPIVTEELWQRAQDALIAHGKRGLRKTKHFYLLEAVARCGLCGSRMLIRSRTTGRRQVNPPAYVCRSRKIEIRGMPRCTGAIVRTADADARAWEQVARVIQDPALLAALVAKQAEGDEAAHDWASDAEGYRRHLERLDRTETAVLARFRRGAITEAGLDTELAALGRERQGVRAQLSTAEQAKAAAGLTRDRLHDTSSMLEALRASAASSEPEARRDVLRALLGTGGVVFDPDAIRFELVVKLGEEAAAASPVERGRRGSTIALASDPGYRSAARESSETGLRIRVVA